MTEHENKSIRIDIDNRNGYDRWAALYDAYPNPTVAADDMAFPAFWGDISGRTVLEIGCGTGRHTQRLARTAHAVTGIDLSAGMLAQARGKVPADTILLQGDFMQYEGLPAADFDMAVMSLVLEHIHDLPDFFARLRRVLRPGGLFFLSEIHPARTRDGVFAHFRDGDAEYHLTSYPHTPDMIESAAVAAGFVVTRRQDVAGSPALADINPKWAKYDGQPMIAMWAFAMAP